MNQTALITGASQGVGKATALLFAQNGYDLVLAARKQERLYKLADEIKSIGRQALAVPCDVTEVTQVNNLIEKALAFYPQIDVLINNAGVCLIGAIAQTTLEDWQKLINTNIWGYIYTINALLPHFLARKKGTIVNVGSMGGKMPLPNMTAYCTSKYAITGLTESLRLELEPMGIHVCGVHPSVTDSDFLERVVIRGKDESENEKLRTSLETGLKSPIASKPEDVAKVIWNVVKHPSQDVVVGSAAFPATAYRFAPGLMSWVMKTARPV